MYIPKEFLNKYGDMNPNSWAMKNGSENPTTFNVMFYFLLERARGLDIQEKFDLSLLLANKYTTNGNKLMTNNYDNDDSFSLDESISYAAACYRYKFNKAITVLSVVTKQTYYRFYDVIPYLLMCKYPLLRYILLPYISLTILLALAIVPKNDTSGKQLALIKIMGQDMKYTFAAACMLLHIKDTSFLEALSIYYPEAEHPINVLAREAWGDRSSIPEDPNYKPFNPDPN